MRGSYPRFQRGAVYIGGPPASGKGALLEGVCPILESLQITHTLLQTGRVVVRRSEVDDEIGRGFQTLMRDRALIPDEVIVPLMMAEYQSRFNPNAKWCAWDGFPRTISQAQIVPTFSNPDLELVLWVDSPWERCLANAHQRQRFDDAHLHLGYERFVKYEVPALEFLASKPRVRLVKIDCANRPEGWHIRDEAKHVVQALLSLSDAA